MEHEIRNGFNAVEGTMQVLEGGKGVQTTEIFESAKVYGELNQVAPTSSHVSQGLYLAVVHMKVLDFCQCMSVSQGRIVKGNICLALAIEVRPLFVQVVQQIT